MIMVDLSLAITISNINLLDNLIFSLVNRLSCTIMLHDKLN